jgi:hypothetical protein
MGAKKGGKRGRGPPKKEKERSPPTQPPPEDEEWYEEVVDETPGDTGAFGGFEVRRPTMGQTEHAEGEQWERYFSKQYHGKADRKVESIEEDWDAAVPDFQWGDLLAGRRILPLGVQSLMVALPLLVMSGAMAWGGQSALRSMEGSAGAAVNLTLVFLALCLTTIAFIQIVVTSVNQAMRERSVRVDGPDITLLGWMGGFQVASRLFVEMILTFLLVWGIELAGLYLLVGGVPDLSIPALDPDNLSAGVLLYLLGAMGSAFAMFGVIPYAIQAAIDRA